MARKSKKLEEIMDVFDEDDYIDENELEELEIDCNFIYELETNCFSITDKRDDTHITHSIESVVLTIIFALLANCNTFEQIYLFIFKHFKWLDKHIKYDNGIPSISTIKRVVSFINPKELENICNETMKKFLTNNEPIYKNKDLIINDIKSMDGKTANSSDRASSKNGEISKMNAMSIISVKNGICEATEFIEDKTNEIPTGPELLKRINIENCLVVFDAMSTQTETIKYIVGKHGYYIAPVKGNQATLEQNLKEYFEDTKLYKEAKENNYYCVNEKAHGNSEKREYIFTNDIKWLTNKDKWLGLKSIGVAKRTYINSKEKTVTDTRYFITNIDASEVKFIGKGIREEWSIENKLHFYLDTVFMEDKNSCFVENTQKNLNILRKFCLSILKVFKKKTKLSMNNIRFNISMDFEYEIEKILKSLYE